MPSLYEITQQLETFAFDIDEETGEFLNAVQWEDLQMAYEGKVENIACYIKNLRLLIDGMKVEEKTIAERRKRNEKKVDYLSSLLLENMGGKKFETAKCSVSFRNSRAVQIDDEAAVPKQYKNEKITYTPDKKAIMAALKEGEEIEGCRIEERTSVVIK